MVPFVYYKLCDYTKAQTKVLKFHGEANLTSPLLASQCIFCLAANLPVNPGAVREWAGSGMSSAVVPCQSGLGAGTWE